MNKTSYILSDMINMKSIPSLNFQVNTHNGIEAVKFDTRKEFNARAIINKAAKIAGINLKYVTEDDFFTVTDFITDMANNHDEDHPILAIWFH